MSKSSYEDTIETCQRGVQVLEDAAKQWADLYQKWEREHAAWVEKDIKYRRFLQDESEFIERQRFAPSGHIWDVTNTSKLNCYEGTTGTWGFGSIYNCNDYSGSTPARRRQVWGCTACGYRDKNNRVWCNCTAGLDGGCSSGRCVDYKSISAVDFKKTPEYKVWLVTQQATTQTTDPGVEPPQPSLPNISADVICTACSSEVNITDNQVGGDLNANIKQTQTCISNLISKEQEAANQEIDDAMAAIEAANTAAERAIAEERLRLAKEKEDRLRRAQEAAEAQERAHEAAKTRQMILFIIITFVLIVIVAIVTAIIYYRVGSNAGDAV